MFGGDLGSGAFQGPLYWALDGDTVSLWERATPQAASADEPAVDADLVASEDVVAADGHQAIELLSAPE